MKADWTGVAQGIGALFGIPLGVIALIKAHSATKKAEQGNALAAEANRLSTEANRLAEEAVRSAKEANDLAAHGNRIAEDVVSERISGSFEIEEDTPKQSMLHKWCADVVIQNVGGRRIQVTDLEFEFEGGVVASYSRDFKEEVYSRTDLPFVLDAQQSVRFVVQPGMVSLWFVNPEDGQSRGVVRVSVLDYKNQKHQLPEAVAEGLSSFFRNWFREVERTSARRCSIPIDSTSNTGDP